MTKTEKAELTTAATKAGTEWANGLDEAVLRDEKADVAALALFNIDSWPVARKNEAYRSAFVGAAVARSNSRRMDLPEVRAARRLARAHRWLEDETTKARNRVDTLADQLKTSTDLVYTMNWRCEDALQGASTIKAATVLAVLVGFHGLDKAIEYATEQAIRGSRDIPRSTSFVSNETERMVASAFADFVDSSRHW